MGNKDKSFFDKFVGVMDNVSDKLSRVNGLMAIKDSFVYLMPLIIVGSFATLFSSVICSPSSGLAQFGSFAFLSNFQGLFSAINFATMNLLSVYLVYLVASTYAPYRGGAKQMAGLTALASFVILLPKSLTAEKDGVEIVVNNVLETKYMDSKGMFLALIVGLTSAMLFSYMSKSDKLKIKMPSSVPSNVAKAFESLIPVILTCFIYGVIGFVFQKITNQQISDAVYKFFQTPMQAVMQFPAGVIILVLFAQCFWAVGIHGANLAEVVRSTIGVAAISANLAAFEAGEKMTNIFTYTFWNTYCTIGGSGCTIGLIIAALIFSKRQDIKAISKLALVPMFFGINEPLIFGLPIVLNPLMVIPFILAPVVSAAIGFFSTSIGFAGPAYLTVPWTTPFLLNGWLSTGSVGTVITQIICIVVVTLIYIPFIKILNSREEEAL